MPNSKYKCPLCGFAFEESDVKCHSCPMAKSCNIICCPNCGYSFAQESSIVQWLKKKFKSEKPAVKSGE